MAATPDSASPFRTDEVRLSEVWVELKAGKLKVVGAKSTDDRHTLTLSDSELAESEPPAEELRILEQSVLRGYQRVALDLGVAPSSVATAAKGAGTWLGFIGAPSRMPPLLVFAILAAHGGSSVTVSREYRQHLVLSVGRGEAMLCSSLNELECAILRLLVEGATYFGIAEKLKMARRLTCNQVVALLKKLGVDSRRELVALVFALVGTDDARVGDAGASA